jgi:hypothetical protein
MSSINVKTVGFFVLLVVPLASLLAGCAPAPPPEEAVLEGTWAVSVQNNPDLQQLLLTFDANGKVTTVTYKLGDNAVITVPSPVGTGTVNGKDVTITAEFRGNGLEFDGTLNDANTIITGSLTTNIVLETIVITIDNGPATLTKQ